MEQLKQHKLANVLYNRTQREKSITLATHNVLLKIANKITINNKNDKRTLTSTFTSCQNTANKLFEYLQIPFS